MVRLFTIALLLLSANAHAGFPFEFSSENQYATVKVVTTGYMNSFVATPKVAVDHAFFIQDSAPPTEACAKNAFLKPLVKVEATFRGSFYTGLGHLPETQSFIVCLFSGTVFSGFIVGEGLYLND